MPSLTMRSSTIRSAVVLLALSFLPLSLAARQVEKHRLPAADGVELALELYLPEKTPAPAVLIRTPYGSGGMDFLGEALAAHGYAVAIQDVRGRYASGGEHEPFRHERSDGLASLKWIAAQPWCDGNIGMWGSSYSGYAALVVADVDLPQFRSIFSISGWIAAEEVVKPGGAMHLMLDLPWMLTQQGRTQRNLAEFDVDALFRHTPLRDALRSAGIRNPTWENPDFLASVGKRGRMGSVKRPVFHVTGWHDMVYRATLDAWGRLGRDAGAVQKLAIGPWYHNQFLFGAFEIGDANFGVPSGFGTDEVIALSLRWFDATLRGQKNGILEEPRVTYFMMGQNAWHQAELWPPVVGVHEERWYLGSNGNANSRKGDGTLGRATPEGAPADHFVFDPQDPVPTLGGAVFFYFPDKLGVRDQREIEERQDVLVYTSPPLQKELQITGRIGVHLHVSSSAPDTDFTAKLLVVQPDGYARIVEEGIARVGHALKPAPPAGTPFELSIDMGYTAISVPTGDRLRLEISSSNFPKYDRNPNTGEDPFLATEFRTAEQTVLHGEGAESYLSLPVRRTPLIATASGRMPLIEPVAPVTVAVAPVDGDDAGKLLEQGRTQLQDGQVEQAIATLQRATELRPEGSEEQLWLGRAYLDKLQDASLFRKLGLSKKVQASFRRAVELDPESLEARTRLASFYFQAPSVAGGSFDKGMQQIAEIQKRDARAAHLLRADAYATRKEIDRAKQEYRAAIALDPSDADPYYGLGLLCQTEKSWAETFAAFEAGVKQADDLRSLYQIGRTAVFSGQHLSRGKEALEQYIARGPELASLPSVASARWRLGMVYEHLGRADLARREYETALRLEPDNEQAREALESL